MRQQFPPDEFDAVVPAQDGRRGAHRARPRRGAALVPVGLVSGATALVAVAAYALLGGAPATSDSASAATPVSVNVAAAPAATGGATVPADPTSSSTSATSGTGASPSSTGASSTGAATSATGGASAGRATPTTTAKTPVGAGATSGKTASASASGRVDASTSVVVLNGTRTSGLAARAATALGADGWTVTSTGNARSGAVSATTVQYADSSLAAAASALATSVGGTAVRSSTATKGVVTVVLGPDYTS